MDMIIKVCGNTNRANAQEVAALGADWLGFIFVPESPRFVTPAQARIIAESLPENVKTVGVFRNQTASEVDLIMAESGLDLVQLHGQEEPNFKNKLHWPVIRVVGVDADSGEIHSQWSLAELENDCDWLLFDTVKGKNKGIGKGADGKEASVQSGGTGKTFDWTILEELDITKPWLIAGGVGPENARKALHLAGCCGIDINSRVELRPGLKDLTKVQTVIQSIRLS